MAQQNWVKVYETELVQMLQSSLATVNLEMGGQTLKYQQVGSEFTFST